MMGSQTERVDFLVIGAGIAGLSAAIRLANVGSVLVITKEELAESNTAYAQGGIAVAMEDEVAGDAAFRDTDGGAGVAGEGDWRGGVADGGVRDLLLLRAKVSAVDLDLATGHGRRRSEVLQMRGRWSFGLQEIEERGH